MAGISVGGGMAVVPRGKGRQEGAGEVMMGSGAEWVEGRLPITD